MECEKLDHGLFVRCESCGRWIDSNEMEEGKDTLILDTCPICKKKVFNERENLNKTHLTLLEKITIMKGRKK